RPPADAESRNRPVVEPSGFESRWRDTDMQIVSRDIEHQPGAPGEPQAPNTYGAIVPAIVGTELTRDGTTRDGELVFPFHLGFTRDGKRIVVRRGDGEAAFEVPHPVTEEFVAGVLQWGGSNNGNLDGLARLTKEVRTAFGLARTFKTASTISPKRIDFLW